MKKLSQAAQVAAILKKKAKDFGMKVRSGSSNYSMGNSVTVKVLTGSDDNLKKLKDYSEKYIYGQFDGMNDCYESTNVRDDIPQTKYLFIDDERAQYIIDTCYEGNKFDDLTFKISGEKVLSYLQFSNKLKEVCERNLGADWVSIFGGICCDLNKENVGVGVVLNGVNFYVEKNKKEAA